MRYISLFSGIEAATVAWEPLGWEPVCFAELDPFPCAVLEHRYPHVPNVGDVTKVNWKKFKGKCDVVVGGSPCQSFSVAGKREGLSGESGLMFEYIRAVREVRPRWFLWENVPGALSSEGGEAFRQLLSEMDKLGYGLAWRVLDAQFFGVAQRRRRVFLVGRLGACPPVEVLFEPEGMRGDHPSSREKRQELAAAAERGASSAGFKFHQGAGAGNIGWESEQPPTCTADWHNQAVCIQGSMIGRSDANGPQGSGIEQDGASFTLNCTDRHAVLSSQCIPINEMIATRGNKLGRGTGFGVGDDKDQSFTITCNHPHAVAFAQNTRDEVRIVGDGTLSGALAASQGMKQTTYVCETANTNSNGLGAYESDLMKTLDTNNSAAVAVDPVICMADDNAKAAIDEDMCGSLKVGGRAPSIAQGRMVVRRLTPMECERLQGFQDDWTKVPYRGKPAEECPDGPRYKAIGNSFAVPVVRWIGERIAMADKEGE